MSFRNWVVLGVLWIISLLAVAGLARAQSYELIPDPKQRILFGQDIGFRVEGSLGGAPAGTLVIRVDGKWVEPKLAPKPPRFVRPSD
jgi:hypothetical protein